MLVQRQWLPACRRPPGSPAWPPVDHLPARVGQAVTVEALASERYQQYASGVRVSAQLLEHVMGVGARVAPTEADHLHIVLDEPPRDLTRDHVSTLDGVDHEDAVADAGSSVVPREAPDLLSASHHTPSS